MSDNTSRGTPAGRGEFFAIDRRAWAKACGQGLNPAVAYLVLARFSGRDQRTTKAGANAVETHTGIARTRAKAALGALERTRLVTEPVGITRRILPAHEVPGCEGYPPPEVDQRERTLLDELTRRGTMWVTDKGGHRTTARSLVAKGRARHLGGNDYEAIPYDAEAAAKPDWIWLPNALVTGAGTEVPPVELVRQSGNASTLRLLVDLYHAQNLTSDGGVHWRRIRGSFRRVRVGERGPFVVWGFSPEVTHAWSDAPFVAPHLTGRVDEKGQDEGWGQFWAAWNALMSLRLVEQVGHLVEADTAAAEIIHPYAVGNGEPVEQELAIMAHEAGLERVRDLSPDSPDGSTVGWRSVLILLGRSGS